MLSVLTHAFDRTRDVLYRAIHHAWVESAFRDFVALDGDRARMLSRIAVRAARAVAACEEARLDPGKQAAFAGELVDACVEIDDRSVGHALVKLRSYEDLTIQVLAFRRLLDWLSPEAPLALASVVLEQRPDARPALLARAELLLERGDLDAALEDVRHALRCQAVCQSAQRLLFRVIAARRAAGATDPEVAVLDYDLGDKFCEKPFTTLSNGDKGDAFVCSCPAWAPYPIGNVVEAGSADEVWNSEKAMEIRRSILDGDFSYCSRTLCPLISARLLPTRDEVTDPKMRAVIDGRLTSLPFAPSRVDLNYDPTCNLACPSCRTDIVTASRPEQAAFDRAGERVILPLLRQVEGMAYISGGGEAFSSRHYKAILRQLNPEEYPGLWVFLITNGLLLTRERWKDYPHLGKMVGVLAVSIDAARPETYERLRYPGRWATLMKNLEFMAELRRAGEIRCLKLNFVVQRDNFREMRELVALGDSLGVDRFWFQPVTNYGTYDQATFRDIDVSAPSHPDHAELLEILRDPVFSRSGMELLMLKPLLVDR